MQGNTYRVVLTGDILEDFNHEDVVQATAKLFKCSTDRARQTLSGKPSPIKKIMDHATAQNYQLQLRKIGIACRLEPAPVDKSTQPNLVLERDAPAKPAVSHRQPGVDSTTPAATGFVCPKCGTAQEQGAECVQCGIIFSKFRAAALAQPEIAASAAPAATPESEMTELDEIALFVGDNTDRYRYQFHQLHHNAGKYQLQWHWAAFLAPIPWMIYRKLYVWAAGFAALVVLLPWYLLLPLTFAPGFLGYFIYYRHAQREIDKLVEQGDQRRYAISMAGGTNSMIITLGASFLAGIVLSILFYTLHIQPAMEKAMTQATGDFKQATTLTNPGIKITQVKMALIKTSLFMQKKMKISIGDHFIMPTNMDELKQILGLPPKADTDAWDTPMQFTIDGDAIIITSAGPDHEFGNQDDIELRATE